MKTLVTSTLFLLIVLFIPSLGMADSITGIATEGLTTTQTGIISATGKIKYYIPIKPETGSTPPIGIYGVDGWGMSSDQGRAPLGGGILDMYIYFDISDGYKGETLTLWFDDLDLKDTNDPTGFFETITFVESSNGELGGDITSGLKYTEWGELEILNNVSFGGPIPENNNNVTITITGLNLSGDFWLNMQFTSYSEGLSGKYYNTPEYLSAKLEVNPVPEPSTIILLGSALIGLGFLRRKKIV